MPRLPTAGTTAQARQSWTTRPAVPTQPSGTADRPGEPSGQWRVTPGLGRPNRPGWSSAAAAGEVLRPIPLPPQRGQLPAAPPAPPAPPCPAGTIAPPPEHLLPILAQLLTGATDVTASQRLGMSPRTFSRRVSELLEHLGVGSRFQAGVASVNQGWVVPRHTPSPRNQ